jgi:FixJ family two-component response regulator
MLTETRSLVCVIDDDAMVRESICLLLDMLGLQCVRFRRLPKFSRFTDLAPLRMPDS